jgi:hypothetical protein
MTRLLIPAALLALALAAGGCGRSGPDGPGGPSAAATSTVAATASSLGPAPDGWPLFTSAAGGYRLGVGAALPPLLLDDDEAVAVATR